MRSILLPFSPRYWLLTLAVLGTATCAGLAAAFPEWIAWLTLPGAILGGLALLGLRDLFQTRHAVLRNYPIAAHLRFLLPASVTPIRW